MLGRHVFIFVALSLLCIVRCSEEDIDESAVVVLTDDNFDETIEKNEFVFVEFYAPWCGHCKHLAPEYAQAAKTLKDEGSSAVVAKVDATIHQKVGQKFGVRGYPTLKFFRSGNPIEYDGGRTAQDIVAFIKRKSGPVSKVLTSEADLTAFTGATGTQVVAYLAAGDETNRQAWLEACKSAQFEDFACGHTTEAALLKDKTAPTAVIFKDGDDNVALTGDFSTENLVAWVSAEGHPPASELAQQVWQRSQTTKTPLVALFYSAIDDASLAQARELGKKFKGKASVSYTATVSIAERWGASGKKLPTAILVKWNEDGAKFVIFNEEGEEFNAATAESFITAGLAGTYKGFQKSEPIPENNNGPVITLVGKNFHEIAMDAKKDVFVEFYAPWCGHCKKLVPVWEELGKAFADTEAIVIAKMDATANSVPDEINVKGFPTLILFTADNKEGITYNGDRDLPSLKKFVADNASNKVNKDEL